MAQLNPRKQTKTSHALFDRLRCPHVGSQQDDRNKWHKNIVLENTASVTRGIIAVYNDIHNMPIGCPHRNIVVAITVAIQ